jgi:hypothetical protein
MTTHVSDDELDAIRVSWSDPRVGRLLVTSEVPVSDEHARSVLGAFLQMRNEWDDLELLTKCLVSRRSCTTDHHGVVFANDHYGNPGQIYLVDGTQESVEVDESAGLRLLARWLRMLVDGAQGEGLDAVSAPTWVQFVQDLETLEERLAADAADASDDVVEPDQSSARPTRDQRWR